MVFMFRACCMDSWLSAVLESWWSSQIWQLLIFVWAWNCFLSLLHSRYTSSLSPCRSILTSTRKDSKFPVMTLGWKYLLGRDLYSFNSAQIDVEVLILCYSVAYGGGLFSYVSLSFMFADVLHIRGALHFPRVILTNDFMSQKTACAHSTF